MFISIQDLLVIESLSRANLIHNQMWAQNDISIALTRARLAVYADFKLTMERQMASDPE